MVKEQVYLTKIYFWLKNLLEYHPTLYLVLKPCSECFVDILSTKCLFSKKKESSQTNVPITKANYEEMQAFATRLENELDKKKFFYPEGKKKR